MKQGAELSRHALDPCRRDFLQKLAYLAGSATAAALAGPFLGGTAQAETVAEDDIRLLVQMEEFRTRYGRASGYLARPRGASAPRPAILVIHEDRGLTAEIRNAARRVALEGYVALAPDFLWMAGGTPADEGVARSMLDQLEDRTALGIAVAAVEFLVARRDTTRHAGALGFAWGGAVVNRVAAASRDLAAAVSFDAPVPDIHLASRIRVPLMLHYTDENEASRIDEFRQALDAAGTDYKMHIYQGAGKPPQSDVEELAWTRTIAFFNETLAAPN